MMTLVVAKCREALIGTKSGEEIHPVDPLLDRVIPAIEAKISSKHLVSEAT